MSSYLELNKIWFSIVFKLFFNSEKNETIIETIIQNFITIFQVRQRVMFKN